MSNKIIQHLASALDLPQDLVLNIPKITLIGKTLVFLENHKGIVEYSHQLVRVNTSLGIVTVEGENLLIKSIVTDEITIDGGIKSVEFED